VLSMNLHTLKRADKRRSRKRVGRGMSSGHGKTAGRGVKGQKSRSGYSRKIGFEGGQMPLIRRIPKRGFKHVTERPAIVNLRELQRFEEGTEVTPELLREAGLIRSSSRKVRILGKGEIDRRLTVRAHGFSAKAQARIEAAGGTCEVIGPVRK